MKTAYTLVVTLLGGCAIESLSTDRLALLGPVDQDAYIKASNTDAGDFFGTSIALSADGSTMAVGAHLEDSSATTIDGAQDDVGASYDAGAVYVFVRKEDGSWYQQAYLKPFNTDPCDLFGFSLALSADGSTLAVGAYREDSAALGIDGDRNDDSATDAGAVYVFERSDGTWTQEAYVKASNTDAGDRFGYSVSLAADGDLLAVGAILEASKAMGIDGDHTDDTISGAGAVYLFRRSGPSWEQLAYVKASNTALDDFFGTSVALSGDGSTLAVGALQEDSAATGIDGDQGNEAAPSSGAVYVFGRSGATWEQRAYVKASNSDWSDHFGHAVGLSADGSVLAVGAPGEASAGQGIGANQLDNSARDAGAVYLFERGGETWTQQAYVKATNAEVGDFFGWSVTLSADGSAMAVGAFAEDSGAVGIGGNQASNSVVGSGAAYLFARSGAWHQTAYLKASNTGMNDQLGWGVALSGDASFLAVSAAAEDSVATGIGGNQSDNSAGAAGAVYVFR